MPAPRPLRLGSLGDEFGVALPGESESFLGGKGFGFAGVLVGSEVALDLPSDFRTGFVVSTLLRGLDPWLSSPSEPSSELNTINRFCFFAGGGAIPPRTKLASLFGKGS